MVALRLRTRGHEVLTPDLPADDDTAGLAEYADTVVEAIGDRADVIVVAQSMAAFTAPMLCDTGHLPALSRPEELARRLESYGLQDSAPNP